MRAARLAGMVIDDFEDDQHAADLTPAHDLLLSTSSLYWANGRPFFPVNSFAPMQQIRSMPVYPQPRTNTAIGSIGVLDLEAHRSQRQIIAEATFPDAAPTTTAPPRFVTMEEEAYQVLAERRLAFDAARFGLSLLAIVPGATGGGISTATDPDTDETGVQFLIETTAEVDDVLAASRTVYEALFRSPLHRIPGFPVAINYEFRD